MPKIEEDGKSWLRRPKLYKGVVEPYKKKKKRSYSSVGPGSIVGIATAYGLHGLGIESRWGARFSAPIQTGLGAHPTSY